MSQFPPPRVVVHLGAHKTATTYIQRALHHHRKDLRRDGVALLLPRHLRVDGGVETPAARLPPAEFERLAAQAQARMIQHVEAVENRSTRRLVLSEEGLIGSSQINLTRGALYPDIVRRLHVLPPEWNQPDTHVLLAIRDYAGFFASNVTTAVRRGKILDIEAARSALLTSSRGWPDVVREILSHLPHARLCLWRYEDFRQLRPRVFTALIGKPLDYAADAVNRTLSRDAMAHILDTYGAPARIDTPKPLIDDMLTRFPITADNPPFALFSQDEVAHFSQRYAQDWKILTDTLPSDCILDR